MAHTDKIARDPPACVASDVTLTRRRGPAAGARDADDARTSVWLDIPELAPWRIRFDFLVYLTDETPTEHEYALAGFAVERPVTIAEANNDPEHARLTRRQVSAFCFEDFANYQRIAELKLRFRDGEVSGRRAAMQRQERGPMFLEMLVDDWRSREGSSRRMHDMELVYNRSRQQIWRWLNEAEAAGLVPEGLPRRQVESAALEHAG